MPSAAFTKFERYMLNDVNALIQAHATLSGRGRGRRGLGHITRSGILMLCASWELYIEELLVEATTRLVGTISDVKALPKQAQKTLSEYVKSHKHDLKPLELAGEGWKQLLVAHARELTTTLNTPKTAPINQMFKRVLGIEEISSVWTINGIDDFVSVRGDIAHKGSEADYVTIANLSNYKDTVCRLVKETDNAIPDYFVSLGIAIPWRRRR